MTAVRESVYRAIEAENARAQMDREAQARRRAGLVTAPNPTSLKVTVNLTPPTLEDLVAAAARALRGQTIING